MAIKKVVIDEKPEEVVVVEEKPKVKKVLPKTANYERGLASPPGMDD